MPLTPVLSLHKPTNSLYSVFTCIFLPMYTQMYTLKERERGEVERRFMFWFFLNGNFCSALMFAAVPTRPTLQLWNERRNIYLQPQRKTSKPDLAPTYMHSNTCVYIQTHAEPDQPQFCHFCSAFIWHQLQWVYPSAHKLLAGDRVSSKPEWTMKRSGFLFWPRRKETHETAAHQWTHLLWRNKSLQRYLILQWQRFC